MTAARRRRLGEWVGRTRHRWKRGRLGAAQVRALEEAGFAFEIQVPTVHTCFAFAIQVSAMHTCSTSHCRSAEVDQGTGSAKGGWNVKRGDLEGERWRG
eukprot:2112366-Rhodomonas_salina.2